MPDPKTVEFRFGFAGMVSKLSPDLLRDGQYRRALNITSNAEGSLSSRTGIKQVGAVTKSSTVHSCYHIRKLCVEPEPDPVTPATHPATYHNLRYLGIVTHGTPDTRDIYRSEDYTDANTALVAAAVEADATKHWEMAPYAGGGTGDPWAFFACPNKMLKDRGKTPITSPLPNWGVQPASGVATAVVLTEDIVITAIADYSLPYLTGLVITLASAAALSDYDEIKIIGTPGVVVTTDPSDGRTNLTVGTWAVRIGIPDSNGNRSNTDTMFQLYDTAGQGVRIASGSYVSGASVDEVPSPGNLDGGAQSSPLNRSAYDYRFCFIDSDTNNRGNPSQTMMSASTVTNGKPVAVHHGKVRVTIWATALSNVTQIKVYRKGGILFDTWRLCKTKTNHGGAGHAIEFDDNIADADLVFAEQIELDNDPPVTSTVATPITSTLSNAGTLTVGRETRKFNAAIMGSAAPWTVKPGTLIHIGGTVEEDCIIESIVSSTEAVIYFQVAHANLDPVTINAITNQPCHLTVQYPAGDCVLVAGDPNNPHILRKSKAGNPEAFPVGTDAAGAVTEIGVGTPANGIVNFCEFRGQVLCMNVSSLFQVALIRGSLVYPAEICPKGLVAQSAWCKTPTEVWFLSTDGVWSWDGSSIAKRSESIDPIFHGQQINGIPPIDMKASALVTARMEYHRGKVRLIYKDTNSLTVTLVCEPLYGDRWVQYDQQLVASDTYVETMYAEPDTQSLVVALNTPLAVPTDPPSAPVYFGIADVVIPPVNYASDWWTTAPSPSKLATEGAAILWDIRLPWFDMGAAHLKKLFEEVWLDLDPQLANSLWLHDSSFTVDLLVDYSEDVTCVGASDPNAKDSFTIAPASGASLTGRQILSLLPKLVAKTSPTRYESYGREARAISFHIYGSAFPIQMSLFRLIFQYQETGLLTAGGATDWMDLGYSYDKRLHQMTVTFDTEGTDRTIVLDTITGVDGTAYNESVQSFILANPSIAGAGRAKKTFPITDAVIAKLVRVRQVSTASIAGGVTQIAKAFFKIISVEFPDFEKFPADIVTNTLWTDGGYPFDKYLNEITLDVDTGGIAITVKAQADNADKFTFTVTSTSEDRIRNITVPTGLSGKLWRLYVDPAQAAIVISLGKFQLFNPATIFRFQQADKGEVGHTFAWDDLGHPYDKLLQTVTIEYDTTVGGPITLQMDTITGIGGVTPNTNVAQFVLGSGRGKTEFAIAPDTIVKMVRLYPAGGTIPAGYKQWVKYVFEKTDYPPDVVHVVPWRDAESPVDKEPSWLWLDADTAGVVATVLLKSENGTVMTVLHTGTSTNRKKNYAIPVDTRAKMWRILPTEGSGGKYQSFGWGFTRWAPFDLAGPIDPPEIILATPWTDLGYPYEKLARNLILTINTGGVPCSVALQTNTGGTVQTFSVTTTNTNRAVNLACGSNLEGLLWRLVFTPGTNGLAQLWNWTLDAVKEPAAVTRWDSYEQTLGWKFFKVIKAGWWQYKCAGVVTLTITSDTGGYTVLLPAHATRGTERFYLPTVWGAGLNKSKIYRVQLSSPAPLKFYPQGSGLEFLALGMDRHSSYQQMTFHEMLTLEGA